MNTRTRFFFAQLAFVLMMLPSVVWAQRGRGFVALEAYIGTSRFVHVGRIVELSPVEYTKPLEGFRKLGKPHRLVFEVTETIRGEKTERMELIMSLQGVYDLNCLRELGVEVMFVGGSPCRDDHRGIVEVGIEEQGKPMDDISRDAGGDSYQFHLLDPMATPEADDPDSVAGQINRRYDFTRMFTNELQIVSGREEILKRARAFTKQYPDRVSTVSLRVPNDFGALCGPPNAYCSITLPICPETRSTLAGIKDDPGLILRRIKPRDDDADLKLILFETHKALAEFPVESPMSSRVELAQPIPGRAGDWVDSDNGDLSLRLGVESTRVAAQENIVVIAEIRNNRNRPITILRPFVYPYSGSVGQISIWDEQETMIKYTGPKYDFDLNAEAFVTLEPMGTTSAKLELSIANHAGTEKPGNYTVRANYSYDGEWDERVAKQGVQDIWRGAICSREVRLKKVEDVSREKPTEEQLASDRKKLVSLVQALEQSPHDPTPRKELAVLARRLAPHLHGDHFVWKALVQTRTLKDGMSLAEAEELLGPPSDKSERAVFWYIDAPRRPHVAPCLHATIWDDGLAEWSITRR